MKCPKCGKEGAGKYCQECGTLLVAAEPDEDEIFHRIENGLAAEADEEEGPRYDMGTFRKDDSYENRDDVRDDRDFGYDDRTDRRDDRDFGYDDRTDRRDDRDFGYDDREIAEEEYRDADDYDEDDYDDEEDYDDDERGGSGIGSALGKGLHKAWDLLCNILRWSSAILMLASAFWMAWGFLQVFPEFGSLRDLMRGDDRALMVFAAGAGGLTAFALLQTLWILKRSRVKIRNSRERRIVDKGHGLFAFTVYMILALSSAIMLKVLPGSNEMMEGVRGILTAYQELGEVFLSVQVLGMILCILRKVCSSGGWD